jgi:hypothetical protein
LRAGTPEQEEFLRKYANPKLDYSERCELLKRVGIFKSLTEKGVLHSYGHAWLKEEVPADVLEWLCNMEEA